MQSCDNEFVTTRREPSGITPLALLRRRRRAAGVLGIVMLANTGCYTYVPVMSTAPQPGEHVAFDLTDMGRVRLNDQLGGNVSRVEGMVSASEGNDYLVSVTRVAYFNAPSANWSGERVRLSRDVVARVEERKFSKGRTLLVVGGALAGIAAFVLTRSILGGGTEEGDTGPPKLPPGGS